MAAGLSESADPGWPGRLGVGVGAWRGFKVLGDIQAQGKTKAEARGRGLGGSVWPNMAAGGAVGAVLGGPGAGKAPKWEFFVFLKENRSFSRSGEPLGGPGRKGLAPFGGLGGASGSPPGPAGRVLGARGGVGGAPREVSGALGRSFGGFGDDLKEF